MRETNPPTNPELLEALAGSFIRSGYDLKALIRAICRSETYQRSAFPNQYNAVDKQNYARYYPKRLSAEVLFDSVNQVTRSEPKWEGLPQGTRAVCLPDNSFIRLSLAVDGVSLFIAAPVAPFFKMRLGGGDLLRLRLPRIGPQVKLPQLVLLWTSRVAR